MACYPGYHEAFCSCPRPELAQVVNRAQEAWRRDREHIQRAARKRVLIKRAARRIARLDA